MATPIGEPAAHDMRGSFRKRIRVQPRREKSSRRSANVASSHSVRPRRDGPSGRLCRTDGFVSYLNFSPDGRTLATGTGKLRLWTVPAGRLIGQPVQVGSFLLRAAFSRDSKKIAAWERGRSVPAVIVQVGFHSAGRSTQSTRRIGEPAASPTGTSWSQRNTPTRPGSGIPRTLGTGRAIAAPSRTCFLGRLRG